MKPICYPCGAKGEHHPDEVAFFRLAAVECYVVCECPKCGVKP